MNRPNIREIPTIGGRIFHNIEYSISKERKRFLILSSIFFFGFLLLFVGTSWYSISSTRGSVYGASAVGEINYVGFDPTAHWNSISSYWQSSAYILSDKIDHTLNTPILVFGSFDPKLKLVEGTFSLGLGQLVSPLDVCL